MEGRGRRPPFTARACAVETSKKNVEKDSESEVERHDVMDLILLVVNFAEIHLYTTRIIALHSIQLRCELEDITDKKYQTTYSH